MASMTLTKECDQATSRVDHSCAEGGRRGAITRPISHISFGDRQLHQQKGHGRVDWNRNPGRTGGKVDAYLLATSIQQQDSLDQ